MNKRKQTKPRSGSPVIIVYESPAAREQALQLSGELQPFAHANTSPCWWSFDLLTGAGGAEAAEKAARAELIVFALESRDDLPGEIKNWIERWLACRGEREGALIGLLDAQRLPCGAASLKEIYLRQVAHRAGMDYLSHTPPARGKAIPDSLESVNARAGCMTSVLSEILGARALPPPIL